FEQRVTKNYPKLEYTVQYRESDLDFVLRMMAHYGISFYFKHQSGSHKLVLADGPSSYDEVPGGSREFKSTEDQIRSDEEHFHRWIPERRFTSGKVTTLDYNHKKPTQDMKGEKTGDAEYDHGELEVYDYPTKNLDKGEGTDFAKLRLNMLRSQDNHHMASGNCLGLSPGMTVTLEKHPTDRFNTEYLTLAASHSYVSESYTSGHGDGGTAAYEGGYEFITADTPIAPEEKIKAPSVMGPQTAVVVGSGEIDCDDEGRILVRFHWDREKTNSMRCRVSQIWAGKGWGHIALPRVGMEVIVEFIEGDPDRPLVTGCVYNGDNKAPFDLPGKKNISGIKSNSTEGGGGYNELVFDDTKGDELFRQHAQYDMETKVLNDERREINGNQTLTVIKNRNTEVHEHDNLDVTKTLTMTANQQIKLKVGQSTITMTPDKITIEALNVEVKAKAQLDTAGTLVNHKATALMTIKGMPIKIN
ncbi:MAG: type VI secretion system Vgr family protein, partial [Rhizobiaceae bacterium]